MREPILHPLQAGSNDLLIGFLDSLMSARRKLMRDIHPAIYQGEGNQEAALKNHITFFNRLFILILNISGVHAQWQSATGLNTGDVRGFRVVGNTVYACTTDGLFRSSDNGLSWSCFFSHEWTWGFYVDGRYIYASPLGSFYRSLDDGVTWNLLATGLYLKNFFASDDSCLFVAVNASGGVLRSLDKGTAWESAGLDDVNGLVFMNNYLFAATNYNGVQRTRDRGKTWQSANNGFDNLWISSLSIQNGRLYATVSYGWPGNPAKIYISNKNGDFWELLATGPNDPIAYWFAFAAVDADLFVGFSDEISVKGNGLFYSKDNGENWKSIDTDLRDKSIAALAIVQDNLLVGTRGGGVWVRSVHDIKTGITSIPYAKPLECKLSQNYPNPFNSSTTIRYELPIPSRVNLKIYNSCGQEVKTLIDEIQTDGSKTVRWDSMDNKGQPVGSGLYLYTIDANNSFQTNKLLLLR